MFTLKKSPSWSICTCFLQPGKWCLENQDGCIHTDCTHFRAMAKNLVTISWDCKAIKAISVDSGLILFLMKWCRGWKNVILAFVHWKIKFCEIFYKREVKRCFLVHILCSIHMFGGWDVIFSILTTKNTPVLSKIWYNNHLIPCHPALIF